MLERVHPSTGGRPHRKGLCTFLKLVVSAKKKLIIIIRIKIKIADDFFAIKELPCNRKSGETVQLVGQDIIYNMSNGKTETNKHVQYAITTKRKIGFRFILDSLNYLGDSISYDEVNNIET